MRSQHLALVRKHFSILKPKRTLVAELTLHRLCARSPAARQLIAGHEKELAAELVRSLRAAVYASSNYTEWSDGLIQLGKAHGKRGVTMEHYREFRVVFLAILAELDAKNWGHSRSDLAQAWAIFFDCMMGHLARGLVTVATMRLAA